MRTRFDGFALLRDDRLVGPDRQELGESWMDEAVVRARLEHLRSEHREILDAVGAGDGDGAADLVEQHIRHTT